MNILSGDGDGGEIKGVRGMEGNRRKERESDEGSERGNNFPTLLKQSTAVRGNTLDVGAGQLVVQ